MANANPGAGRSALRLMLHADVHDVSMHPMLHARMQADGNADGARDPRRVLAHDNRRLATGCECVEADWRALGNLPRSCHPYALTTAHHLPQTSPGVLCMHEKIG
jgi:hypothetical protein